MPIVPQEQAVANYGGVAPPTFAPRANQQAPSFLEGLSAVFEEGNTVGSSLKFLEYEKLMRRSEVEEGYDPFSDIAGYEDEAGQFATSLSRYNTAIIKRRIDDERATREQINRAGGWGIAGSIMAGVLDPVNLVPVGGAAAKAKTVGQGIKAGLEVGFKSSLLTEGILQATQVDRSLADSAFNVTGGTLFGGILGGTGGAWSEWRGKPVAERALEAEYRAGVSSDDLTPEVLTTQIDELVTRRRAPVDEAPFVKTDAPRPATPSPLDPKPFQFEEALPALRENYKPKKAESLVEFIARTGGVSDPGGELSAIDADLWHRGAPFRRKLINDGADGLDGVRERAVEAGYLPEGASTDDVLQAVRQELAGKALYSMAAERSGQDLAAQVSELQEIMDRAGLTAADPDDVIRKGVRDFLADQELEDALAAWEKERGEFVQPQDIEGDWVDAGGISAQSSRIGNDALRPAPDFGLSALEAKNPISANPLLRALTSPSVVTPRVMSELAEIPIYQRGNAKNVASPVSVESQIRAWNGPLAQTLTRIDDEFVRYRLGKQKGLGDMARTGLADMTGQGGGKLTFLQFKEEVARAMRRGDVHPIKEVGEAAKYARKTLVDPLKDEAIAAKLLDEGVKPENAISYLTRVYDLEFIARNRNKITAGLADWFETSAPRGEGLTRAEYLADAGEVIDTLMGGAPGRTAYDLVPNVRGPLKERTLNVPDDVLDQLGMLENDVERVLRIYTRTMSADVEIARVFDFPDMRNQVGNGTTKGELQIGYEKLMSRTPDGPKQAALQKRMQRDVADVSAVRDRLRGTYGRPDDPNSLAVRIGRGMRQVNYLRLLGGMTISAIPDVARVTLAGGGFGKTLQRGLLPLIANTKAFKLAAAEVRMAGTALDMVLDTRAMQMADVFEDYGRYSKFERGLNYAGEKFGLVSGMSLWNGAMKSFTGVMVQSRMLQAIMGDTTPAMRRRLRFLTISPAIERRIAGQFQRHGAKDGEVWVANTKDWTDKEAVRIYRAALAKEVDSHIISPGQEKPLWMSTELGKTIGQFKSFTFSSMSRALIRGLQERDAATAQSAILAASLGMMVYYLKTKAADKEPSDNPGKWVLEGIDRSGMTGWLMEANGMAEKVSGGRIGLNPIIGETTSSRFAARGVTETLAGPSLGLVEDTAMTTGAVAQALIPGPDGSRKPMTRAQAHKVRRLIPFQNVFYLNWLFNAGEDAVGDAAGMPENPPK
jgi:hypothetical protein